MSSEQEEFSKREVLDAQAKLLVDEHETCKAVMNETVFSVGVLTLASLIALILLVLRSPSNPLWSYVLGGLSIIFVIGTAPMWGLLGRPKCDIVAISPASYRGDLLKYHKNWFKNEIGKKVEEEDLPTKWIKVLSIWFTRDFFMWLGGIFFATAWVLSLYILISVKYEETASIFFLLFSLSILAFSLLGVRTGLDYSLSRRLVNGDSPFSRLFSWSICIVPTKLREGDSQSALIGFELDSDFQQHLDRRFSRAHQRTDKLYIEAELHSKGVDVEEDKNRQLFVRSETAIALWNCYFSKQGRHEIALTLSATHSPSDTKETFFAYQHTVKVEGLLVATWQPVLTLIVSVLTAFIGIYKASTPFTFP